MKIVKGKSDSWGIGISYCNYDKSISFDFVCWYVAFIFHRAWKN